MDFYPVISGPVAPFNNLPIEPQWYQPSQFPITGLIYGVTTTVTMANGTNGVTPNYVIGQQVRLTIPSKYGAGQLNEQTGYVLSIPTASSVVVNINSIGTDPFVASPTFLPFESKTPPQIMAIGDINSGPINAQGRVNNGTFIPGSFIDISPL
jgi:hypothetical protein